MTTTVVESIPDIEHKLSTLTGKRPGLETQLRNARAKVKAIKDTRDALIFQAVIDNDPAAQEKLQAETTALNEVQRSIHDLETALQKLDEEARRLHQHREQAKRQEMTNRIRLLAKEQQRAAADLDRAIEALMPKVEQWVNIATTLYGLRHDLGDMGGRTPRRVLADCILTAFKKHCGPTLELPVVKLTFSQASERTT